MYNPYGGGSGFDIGLGAQSMTSMGSTVQTTQQQSVLSKTVNMVSSLTTHVVDGASTIGEAVGLKSNKKGIMGNPHLAGSMQN